MCMYACMFNKMTDERLLNQMCQKLKRKTDRNGNPTPASCFRNPGFKFRNKFVVVHSANEVMYSVDQFIEKNKDTALVSQLILKEGLVVAVMKFLSQFKA